MTHKIHFFFWLLIIIIFPTNAQIFEYIGVENGLSSRRVFSICQDKQGYIWLLTHKGVDRYDGKQFVHYNLSHNQKTQYFYPNLNILRADNNQRVWEIGKDGYIFLYNELKDSFQLAFDLNKIYPSLKKQPISATYMDASNRIWMCINENIILYDIPSKHHFRLPIHIKEKIVCVTPTEKENEFFLATEIQIYRIHIENFQLKDIQPIHIPHLKQIDYIYYHQPSNCLIINSHLDNIYAYNLKKQQLTALSNSMADIVVNTIIPDRTHPNTLYIATDGQGVYKLSMNNLNLMGFLQEDPHKPNKMNGNIVKDIYIDRSGRLWNVVFPTGITIYSEQYPGYQWLVHSPNNPNSLANNYINDILEDADGDIWYATSNGISCFNTSKKAWSNYLSSANNNKNNENHIFTALCEMKPGVILAGGYMSGVYMIEKSSHRITFFQQYQSSAEEKKFDKYIRCICQDKENIIWTGGFYYLKSHDLHSQKSHIYNIGYPITTIKPQDTNTLWIGTINGMYIFDKQSGKSQPFNSDTEMGCINTIFHHPKNGLVYIGTSGKGFFVADNKGNILRHYHSDNCGLESNDIYSFIPDQNGNLYLGTDNGLTFFDLASDSFNIWTKEQGLLASSFNPDAAIHSRNGEMIFGSNEGVIILPDNISLPPKSYNHMIFTNLKIMYQTVHAGEKGSPLSTILDQTKQIKLKYNQNTFSLNVSSINFDNPSNIAYSWKLEGFYDKWSPLSTNGLIQYTNLSPGNYTLHVRSVLANNQKILEQRTIRILIGRPLWLTFWAFLIYALVIIGITYLVVRIKMIRREKQISQEKINFFVHTAHDIRTPLTLIKAPLGEILKDETLSEKGLSNLNLALQSTESLSDLADNLLNFQKESLYSSHAIVHKCGLNRYLRTFLQQFQAYAIQKNIRLTYKSTFTELETWIDYNKINSILRNLISNALKYTPNGGEINIETDRTKDRWTLTIKDTGIGIPKEDQKKLFRFLFRGGNVSNQPITGTGIGMLLTYRLIRNHDGRIYYNSTENVGTTFTLNIPIHSERYIYRNDIQTGNITDEDEHEHLLAPTLHHANTQQAGPNAPLILLVEDNANLRNFLAENLANIYRIEQADNGQEALKKIHQNQPDMVISDIMMPVMDGEKLCAILKNDIETSHIPVILLTALGTKEDILRGLKTRADLYIVKPFDLTVLKANINNLLENRELIRKKLEQASLKLEPPTEKIPLPSGLDEEFIQKVTAFIKENLRNNLTVDTLCAAMNMSRTSFYNKIKALIGIAPADFIRNIRMKEAASLLKSQQYTVAEVSDMTGFADPKYFTDLFKKFYGKPPSTYKKDNNFPNDNL